MYENMQLTVTVVL